MTLNCVENPFFVDGASSDCRAIDRAASVEQLLRAVPDAQYVGLSFVQQRLGVSEDAAWAACEAAGLVVLVDE